MLGNRFMAGEQHSAITAALPSPPWTYRRLSELLQQLSIGGQLAAHVAEVTEAILSAARDRRFVAIESLGLWPDPPGQGGAARPRGPWLGRL